MTFPALATCFQESISRPLMNDKSMPKIGSSQLACWTPRGEVRRIISMRKANDREKSFYAQYLD